MADLAVFLSNPGHHVATLAPVVDYLARRGVSSRVHSFCELRGYPSPVDSFSATGTTVLPAWPAGIRRSARSSDSGPGLGAGRLRKLVHEVAWRSLLAPRLRRQLDATARLAVLPNDSAFPYDRVAALLRDRCLPFVLVQEGVRFPLPAESTSRYGLGGARALAVWGQASADHFRSLGVDPARIHVTGSPRFDLRSDAARAIAKVPREDALALLLVTNPIDAQGFCRAEEKTELVARFVSHLRDALTRGRASLMVRPHPGESIETYSAAMSPQDRALVSFDADRDLDAALAASDVAIVMASTVGLEALQQGVPLAVLPTPGHGFVHDYVERKAALGVALDDSLENRLTRHATPTESHSAAVDAYLGYHLAFSGQATRRIGQLMIDLLDDE